MPLLSSPAHHCDAELACCPNPSKTVGLRRLIVIISDETGNPWKTHTPGSPSVMVTVHDAISRGSPEQAFNAQRVVSTTAESPRASSRAAGFAFHTWSFQTEDGDP